MGKLQTMLRAVLLQATAAVLLTGCEETAADLPEMRIQSAAFGQDEAIPDKFTCNGSGTSPPLSFSRPPDGTKSLAVVMEEPEHIIGTFTHWLIWGLPARTVIPENAKKYPPEGAIFGTADDKEKSGYDAPCPPKGETHEFVFRVYALDKKIAIEEGAKREKLDAAMDGHILAEGELVGIVTGRRL